MRTKALIAVGVAIALLLLFGWPKQQPPAPPQRPSPPARPLTGLPVEMTVEQRTTTPAPGSQGVVQVTIDDITRGQAMVSLAAKTGESLLAPTSLEEGDSASFELDGETYYVTVADLSNELIGEDSAVLMLDDQPPAAPAEQSPAGKGADASDAGNDSAGEDEAARISRLIEHVRSLEGAVFIRNGEEHTPAQAAEHLQRKWDYARDQITTAQQFIEELASKSSTSGEEYIIRFDDGKEVRSGEYLRQQLEEMN